MLDGIRLYSADETWRRILSELGAVVADVPNTAYLNFDELGITMPATPATIKTAVQNAVDSNLRLLHTIFGRNVRLPYIQAKIIIMLYKSGGLSGADLRTALGYSPNATTHAVDTAIYQLRKTFGRDFIINTNGVYKIGRI